MTEQDFKEAQKLTLAFLDKTGIMLSTQERTNIEVADLGLSLGTQYTIAPMTLRWFQASHEGAILSEFSSISGDQADFFTDPRIKRIPEITDD